MFFKLLFNDHFSTTSKDDEQSTLKIPLLDVSEADEDPDYFDEDSQRPKTITLKGFGELSDCSKIDSKNNEFDSESLREEGDVSTRENTPKEPIFDVQDFSTTVNNGKVNLEEEKADTLAKGIKTQIRWRKKDDSKLYDTLLEEMEKRGMSFDELRNVTFRTYNPEFLVELIKKTGWRGSCLTIKQRILKLIENSKTFSSRELKKLRKIYYKMIKADKLDWKELKYHFPGKNLDYIKETCHSFPRSDKLLKQSHCFI